MRLIFTGLFCILSTAAFTQIPNGDFENWTSGEPDNWITSNTVAPAPNVLQSSTAYHLSSAARLEISTDGSNNYVAEIGCPASGGYFSMSGRPVYLAGWYMADFLGDDYLQITALLNDSSNGFGGVTEDLVTPSAVYKRFAYPISYFTVNNMHQAQLDFKLTSHTSDFATTLGSYVLLDELEFSNDSLVLGIPEEKLVQMTVYPNPVNETSALYYSLPQPSAVRIELVDMTGKLVKQLYNGTQGIGEYKIYLANTGIAEGIYNLVVCAGGTCRTQKISISNH